MHVSQERADRRTSALLHYHYYYFLRIWLTNPLILEPCPHMVPFFCFMRHHIAGNKYFFGRLYHVGLNVLNVSDGVTIMYVSVLGSRKLSLDNEKGNAGSTSIKLFLWGRKLKLTLALHIKPMPRTSSYRRLLGCVSTHQLHLGKKVGLRHTTNIPTMIYV